MTMRLGVPALLAHRFPLRFCPALTAAESGLGRLEIPSAVDAAAVWLQRLWQESRAA
jgi:hypothetical protein